MSWFGDAVPKREFEDFKLNTQLCIASLESSIKQRDEEIRKLNNRLDNLIPSISVPKEEGPREKVPRSILDKQAPASQDYRYVNDAGPNLSTVMLVSAMCTETPSKTIHNEDSGWTSSYRDSTFSDSSSSSYDSGYSSSCDSSSSSSD